MEERWRRWSNANPSVDLQRKDSVEDQREKQEKKQQQQQMKKTYCN
jgi:hypothetical protein